MADLIERKAAIDALNQLQYWNPEDRYRAVKAVKGCPAKAIQPDQVQTSGEDFGIMLLCAIRYAAGRQSYMPGLVQDFARPLIPALNSKTLQLVERDLTEYRRDGRLGDLQIDAPGWIRFLTEVREEMQRRKIERLV